MYGRDAISEIDWRRYRLTPFRIFAICFGLLAIAAVISVQQFSNAPNNVLPGGAPVGGDYVAFYGAAIAAAEGDAAQMYDYDSFEAQLQRVGPPLDEFKLTWQYPPTYFLLLAPFAFLPFIPGYIAWTGGAMALYFGVMRKIGFSWFFLFVIFAAPSTFQAIITGQNGFLTATLLAIAALTPDKRPLLAGLAAALLTIKPQLGVLLPIAYLAGGYWRAFLYAAFGSIAFAGAATAAFGADIWIAFLDGFTAASERLGAGVYPLFKMATPFAWMKFLGAPFAVAAAFHAVFAALATAVIARVWRCVNDAELRAAAL
ncbi:MAG: glycosyltransferase family 87 protein, partial [Pseudomonadota bacterium]